MPKWVEDSVSTSYGTKLLVTRTSVENDFFISITNFKLPWRRLYTWKSNVETEHKVIRNKIDFILITHRFRNNIQYVKTYPGADIGSNHNTLSCCYSPKVKKSEQREVPQEFWQNSSKKLTSELNIQRQLNKKEDLGNNADLNKIVESMKQVWVKGTTVSKKNAWMKKHIIELIEL